uniref:Large ribosomal subunit protein uL18c n=1 Tax=Chondria sp. (in: red algae) TaxID=1982705 RepID=A0A1Z1MD34_9FLOR|nr:ribosomal protein L18 [Chondria sp. (in: red algae)]
MRNKNFKTPKLYIFKSNKHIYAQVIDQENNKVITSSSTLSTEIKNGLKYVKNCKTAAVVGENIASKLKQLGISEIIFDRGKNIYHGQIKALADATRGQGIIF